MTIETVETYDGQPGTPPLETRNVEVPPETVNERSIRDKIEQHIAAAEGAAGTQAAWAALTNAQRDEALRRTVLAVAKMGRFLLQRFDTD